MFGFSIVSGGILYLSGGGETLEKILTAPFPGAHHTQDQRESRWMKPEDGFLAGEIVGRQEQSLEIQDFLHHTWTVDISHAQIIPGQETLQEERIRMLGTSERPGQFTAEKILPWGGDKKERRRPRHERPPF